MTKAQVEKMLAELDAKHRAEMEELGKRHAMDLAAHHARSLPIPTLKVGEYGVVFCKKVSVYTAATLKDKIAAALKEDAPRAVSGQRWTVTLPTSPAVEVPMAWACLHLLGIPSEGVSANGFKRGMYTGKQAYDAIKKLAPLGVVANDKLASSTTPAASPVEAIPHSDKPQTAAVPTQPTVKPLTAAARKTRKNKNTRKNTRK